MDFFSSLLGSSKPKDYGVAYWDKPDRVSWLYKQGEHIKTWRRRWFVMKDGKIFWFLHDVVNQDTVPRGVIDISNCLSIKGAEDVINKPFSFEIATNYENLYFIANDEKEKEDWINIIGKAIVKHGKSIMTQEQRDY